METLLLTNAHRIIWAAIKAIILLMLFYYLYDSILIYPAFPEGEFVFGEFIVKIFIWLYSFISSNWQTVILLFILGYSWASYRINKITSRRIEQIEVISFSQLSYFNYNPITDINRITSGKEFIKSILTGWFLSWFGLDNPYDLPWSAKPDRFAKDVTLQYDLSHTVDKDNE